MPDSTPVPVPIDRPAYYTYTFLTLPREVRDMITFHVLKPEGRRTIYIECPSERTSGGFTCGTRRNPPDNALLFVCRQMATEGAETLYRENTFDLTYLSGSTILSFLKTIGNVNAAQVKRLVVDYCAVGRRGGPNSTHRNVLRNLVKYQRGIAAKCSGLRRLEIHADGNEMHRWNSRQMGQLRQRLIDVNSGGLDKIDEELVRALPNLQRMIFVIRGSEFDLIFEDCDPVLRRVRQLGWEAARYGYIPSVFTFNVDAEIAQARAQYGKPSWKMP